ncbi:MAG: MoaD/ThiS family protein [Micromonosporaceae bacterium]|nr:MoaD/ThiS family protein [Micromonosporaceae bacterium]
MLTVRYFAGARAAAGVAEDQVPPGCTLHQLTATLVARRGERLGRVLGTASFLVDGLAWRDRDRPLPDPAVVDVLPPFAGG